MINPVSYGFVSDGGVERAAKKAIEYRREKPWVFKTDITKFFDYVDRNLLRQKIAKQIKQKTLHELLFEAVSCEIKTSKDSHISRLKKLDIVEGRGVRQGMPLSPFFANLFLAEFDRACIKYKISVLRYADDLIFFAANEAEARKLHIFCSEELEKIKLLIPALVEGSGGKTKTNIYDPTTPADFLGVELAPATGNSYQIRLTQNQFNKIKEALYYLSDLSELKRRNLNIARFGNSLSSRVESYSSTYGFCANHARLESSLQDWMREVHRKVATALGIDTSKLSDEGRWFLGLK